MVWYIPVRGRGIQETAAVRAGAPPLRYHRGEGEVVEASLVLGLERAKHRLL